MWKFEQRCCVPYSGHVHPQVGCNSQWQHPCWDPQRSTLSKARHGNITRGGEQHNSTTIDHVRETATWCRFSYRGWYRRFWAPSSALSKWGSYQCHVHEITCSAKVYDRHQDHCAKTPCHRSWLACSACVVELWYRANPLRNWQGYCAEVPNAAPESLTMLGSLNAPLSEVVHQSSRKWYVRDPLQSPALPIQSPPRKKRSFHRER